MKRFVFLSLGLFLFPMILNAEVRYVQIDKARLLKQPSAFGAAVGTLSYRTSVEVLGQKGPYMYVQTKLGKGYLAESSLTLKKPKFASRISGEYVSSEEVATATKGFNSQVESEYRKSNPKLPYNLLDQLESETKYPSPQTMFVAFRKHGKLGEFKEGGMR